MDSYQDEFLAGVHRKIRYKKNQRTLTKFSATVLVVLILAVQAPGIIKEIRMQNRWNNYVPELAEYYTPDEYLEIDSDIALEYLIQEMSLDEIMSLLQSDDEITNLLTDLKLEG